MSVSPVSERHLAALPTVRTPLLGRDDDIDQLRTFVASGDVRLVTITGPGGVGKTRLAVDVAARLADGFDGDVVFVPLASVRNRRLVLLAIGQAYGLVSDPDDGYEERLIAFLRDRASLLVLDNLEQVLDVAPVLQRMRDACSALTILATSQVALDLPEERVYVLAPLPTLDPATTDADALVDQDAFTLFMERAQSVDPGVALAPGATLAVAEICYRLGGLPLAIELAAARCNVLSPRTLLERLGDHLRLLAQDRGDVPDRQRTMHAAVGWSYNLLDPVEQAFFRWLSIFSGGFAVDAAMAMFTPGGGRTAADVLGELVARSLVQHDPATHRYMMLESLRNFGQEQLAALGEEPAGRLVHADWATRLAEDAETALQGPDQHQWLLRLDADMENIRAAVVWSLANDHSELVMRIAGSIWHYFPARGLVTEGRAWLSDALATTGPAVAPFRAKALVAAGHLAHERRDLDVAYRYFTQARTLAEAIGDRTQEVAAIYGLGHVAHIRNQFVEAVALHTQGMTLAREIGNQRQIVVGESNLGLASFFQGKLEEAVQHWETALEAIRPLGDLSGEAMMLGNIGSATIRLGDVPKAKDYLTRALELQRMLATRTRLLSTLNNLAIIHLQLQELDRAAELFDEAMALYREDGDIPGQAQIAHGYSNLDLERGNIEGAASWFLEAVRLISETQDTSNIFDYTALLATICEQAEQFEDVVEILAGDSRLRRELDFQTMEADEEDIRQTLAGAREAIGKNAYDAAWSAGECLDQPGLMRRMSTMARRIVGRRVETPTTVDAVLPMLTDVAGSVGSTAGDRVLTAREVEVVKLLAAGKATTEIADELFVSARTVTTHIAHILEKLDVPNRTAAVAWAMREGIA